MPRLKSSLTFTTARLKLCEVVVSDGSSSVAVTVTVLSPTSACVGAAVMIPVDGSMVAKSAPVIENVRVASGSSSEK